MEKKGSHKPRRNGQPLWWYYLSVLLFVLAFNMLIMPTIMSR